MVEPLSTIPSSASSMSGTTGHPFSSSAPSFAAGSNLASASQSTTPGRARKQAQAQRSRLVALSKHLATRLQYATFKVEHGWAKQSLSEVENLYYRQNQGASSSAARSSSSTSPTGTNKQAPVTPSAAADPPINSRLFKDAALKRSEPDGGDVFGGYGLATPPASGGTQPSSYSLSSHATRRQSGSQTPVSPPGSAQPVESAAVKRSPSKGLGSNASSFNAKSGAATQQPQSASSLSGSRPAASGATSYADFWSRVGSSSATSKQGEREPAAATAASVPRRSSLVGAKRPADTSDDLASAGSEEAGGSPLKRVRMDLRESPAKNTPSLQERGSSFAARTREGNDGLPRLGRVGSPSPGARS